MGGGEEFLILLQNTEISEAYPIVENLRRSFEQDLTFCYKKKNLKISLTYGLTEYNNSKKNVLDCINNADKALMKGKKQGKNCVVVCTTTKEGNPVR